MRRVTLAIAAALSAGPAPHAMAQAVPFFSPAGTGFDPEISVVNSGEILDAQPVVSKDRKYVTIGAQPSSSKLLALRAFPFQTGGNRPLGLVGGANGGQRGNALDRVGTRLISRLD